MGYPMFQKVAIILVAAFMLVGCKNEKDPEQVELERRFEREAVLVRTCPADPRLASGPTAVATRVYRFEEELWFEDRSVLRRVDATPEDVCAILQIYK
jgi:hypothetical protein